MADLLTAPHFQGQEPVLLPTPPILRPGHSGKAAQEPSVREDKEVTSMDRSLPGTLTRNKTTFRAGEGCG